MINKAKLLKTLSDFPEEFSIEDLIEKLIFMQKVENGLHESSVKKIVSEEEARKKLAKWLR